MIAEIPFPDLPARVFLSERSADRYAPLRAALSATCGTAGPWQIARRRHRPPDVRGPSNGASPAISIARAGGLVVVAIGDAGAIGVDIELPQRVAATVSPSDRWLSPSERRACYRGGSDALAAHWVLKEAYGKALGIGLPDDPSGWSFAIGAAITLQDRPPGGIRFALHRHAAFVVGLAFVPSSTTR